MMASGPQSIRMIDRIKATETMHSPRQEILHQRPAKRQGFNVTGPSVPRSTRTPGKQSKPSNSNILENANVSVPIRDFIEITGMSDVLTKLITDTRRSVVLAQSEQTLPKKSDVPDLYQTMRIQNDAVFIKGFRCNDIILDTGASFSMVSRTIIELYHLHNNLVQSNIAYVTADGNTANAAQMLNAVDLKIGECCYVMDLVVTESNIFDVLLGVDFLDKAKAKICMDRNLVVIKGRSEGNEITQTISVTTKQTKLATPIQATILKCNSIEDAKPLTKNVDLEIVRRLTKISEIDLKGGELEIQQLAKHFSQGFSISQP